MPGLYYEDASVGHLIKHRLTRTVTESDDVLFCAVTPSPQPLHLDVEAAKQSGFGQILVNSTFTFSLLVGLSVGDTTLGTLVANLGFNNVVTPKPVFVGDTLRAETEVKELKESQSRPEAGIVTFTHELFNQRDEVVCRCERAALLQRSA